MSKVTKAITRMEAQRAADNGYRLTPADFEKVFARELARGGYIHSPVLITRHYGLNTKYFYEAHIQYT